MKSPIDPERLQDTLDDIAGTVEWAAEYIESLEEEVRWGESRSDMPGLRAELARLRLIADCLLPGRVRDPESRRRWYLAQDDATLRASRMESELDKADSATEHAFAERQRERDEDEQRDRLRSEEAARRQEKLDRERSIVHEFLRTNGASTAATIASETGLDRYAAEMAAKSIAKRGRDRKFRLEPDT